MCDDLDDAAIDIIFEIIDSTDTVVESFDADDLYDGEERIFCAQDSNYNIEISDHTGTYLISDEDIDPYLERSNISTEADPYDLESPGSIVYEHFFDLIQSGILTLTYELYNTNNQKYCKDGVASLPIVLPDILCTNATST